VKDCEKKSFFLDAEPFYPDESIRPVDIALGGRDFHTVFKRKQICQERITRECVKLGLPSHQPLYVVHLSRTNQCLINRHFERTALQFPLSFANRSTFPQCYPQKMGTQN
jgi:hypothetical protein